MGGHLSGTPAAGPFEGEQLYKRLLASVTDYMYLVEVEDGQAVATRHGPGCVKVTGYTSQDYEANPQLWYDMIYADDRATVQGQTAWLVAGEDAAPIEHRLIHQDGSIRWVRNTAVLQYDPSGRFVGYSGLIEDITERKQMEEMLRESEEKYRTLIEQSDDAIYLIYGGKFVVINRRFQELFGVSPEDIIEPDFVFTNIVSPKSRKLVSAWTSEGQGKKVSPRYEFAAINRKGDEIDDRLLSELQGWSGHARGAAGHYPAQKDRAGT
jgi:PAS domain S-box-containing protein